jgi:hypothetical protein
MLPLRRSVATRLAGCVVACALALAAAAFMIPAVHPAEGQPYPARDDAAVSLAGVAELGNGCSYHQISGGYQWVCTNVVTTPGGQTAGQGGGSKPTCTLAPISQAQASYLGLQWPAPAGHTWEAITCPGTQPFGGVVLAGGTAAAPTLTPQQVIQIALDDIRYPELDVQTVPPLHHDGLVGLPEWFWVPDWHAQRTPRIQAGPFWAIATATPKSIIINPGGGLAPVPCPGPGTPYNPALPPGQQHTDCSYTYQQPSTGQPGNAYAASVTVLWKVSWIGSAGGATVTPGHPVTTPLIPGIRVAAAQALVTGP